MSKKIIVWLPAVLMMLAIFAFSSIPSTEMPYFNWADLIVKKGGHMLGYGLLAMSYWFGLGSSLNREERKVHKDRQERNSAFLAPSADNAFPLAWLLAVLYAMTDEFHQSFVPGRTSSWIDVGIDALGAALILFLYNCWQQQSK